MKYRLRLPLFSFLLGLITSGCTYAAALLLLGQFSFWAAIVFAIGLLFALAAIYFAVLTFMRLYRFRLPVASAILASIGGVLGVGAVVIFIVGQFT